MVIKSYIGYFSAVLYLLLLAACGTEGGRELSYSSGDVLGYGNGIYKVGSPYEINDIWYYPYEDYNYDETGVASWYGPYFHGRNTANGEVYNMNDLTAAHRTLPMPCFVRVTNLDNGRSIVLRINDRGPYAKGRIIDLSRRSAEILEFDKAGTARVRVQIMADESRKIAQIMRVNGLVASYSKNPPLIEGAAVAKSIIASNKPAVSSAQVVAASLPSEVAGLTFSPSQALVEERSVSAALKAPTGYLLTSKPRKTAIYVQVGAFAYKEMAAKLKNELDDLVYRIKNLPPVGVLPVVVNGQRFYRVRVGPMPNIEAGDLALEQIVSSGYREARLTID